MTQVTDDVIPSDSPAVSTSAATSDKTFRYDSTSNEYIYNLDTKSLIAGTIQLTIDLGDGSTNVVQIELR